MVDEIERVYGNRAGKSLYDEFLDQTLPKTYRSNGYENGETKRKKRFVNSQWDEKPTIIKALYVLSCFL